MFHDAKNWGLIWSDLRILTGLQDMLLSNQKLKYCPSPLELKWLYLHSALPHLSCASPLHCLVVLRPAGSREERLNYSVGQKDEKVTGTNTQKAFGKLGLCTI